MGNRRPQVLLRLTRLIFTLWAGTAPACATVSWLSAQYPGGGDEELSLLVTETCASGWF
jgi:hypothetical protein